MMKNAPASTAVCLGDFMPAPPASAHDRLHAVSGVHHLGHGRVYAVHLSRGDPRVRSEAAAVAQHAEAKRRPPLSRDRVLRAAVALADEAGLESLSMRRLARQLGVVPMAPYKHVANK